MKKLALIGTAIFLFGMILFFVAYGLNGFQLPEKAIPSKETTAVHSSMYTNRRHHKRFVRYKDDEAHARYGSKSRSQCFPRGEDQDNLDDAE